MSRPEDISTVVGLFRVSTESQEKDGYSLQAQQTAYDRDCRTFKWRSLDTFKGQETGSALASRETIHELIGFLRSQRPDAIWVIEQSRLTRGDELDVAVLLRELRENNTKIVLERGTVVDPTDLEGGFSFRLKALMDRREWEVITARNKRGKDEKAKRGLLVNARPAYGYKTSGEGREKGKRVPIPEEAAVVRQIFEWTVQGLSARKITKLLFEQGTPAPTQVGRISGKRPQRFKNELQLWSRSTIRRILDNPIYLGVSFRSCWIKKGKQFVFDQTNPNAIWVENAHEPIIERDLWDAAHRQIQSLRGQRHIAVHMLTGLMVCPRCGNTFSVTSSKKNKNACTSYYYCRSKRQGQDEFGNRSRNGKACLAKWLRVDDTDKIIWDAFIRLISSPEMVEQYLASTEAENRRARVSSEIVQIEESIRKLEAMMTRAREKLLTEILTDGEYLKERNRLENQLQGSKKRLSAKQAELGSANKDAARKVMHNLALLKLAEKKLSRDQRSRLFHALVKRVVIKNTKLEWAEIELYVKPVENGVQIAKTGPIETGEPLTPAISLRLPLKSNVAS